MYSELMSLNSTEIELLKEIPWDLTACVFVYSKPPTLAWKNSTLRDCCCVFLVCYVCCGLCPILILFISCFLWVFILGDENRTLYFLDLNMCILTSSARRAQEEATVHWYSVAGFGFLRQPPGWVPVIQGCQTTPNPTSGAFFPQEISCDKSISIYSLHHHQTSS